MEAVAALAKRLDRDYFVRAGRRGGKKGGAKGAKAGWAKLTPEQRRQKMQKAALARWKKFYETTRRKP